MATINVIRAYQSRGHLYADLDPLQISLPSRASDVEDTKLSYEEQLKNLHDYVIRNFYLSITNNLDWDRIIALPNSSYIGGDQKELPFRDIVRRLQESYSGHIGLEYMHITTPAEVDWLREQMETPNRIKLTDEQKKRLLERLIRANHLEQYLAKKWPGEKRFGLEGCEVSI